MPATRQLATVKLEASSGDTLQTLRDFAEFWKVLYTDDSASVSHQVTISAGTIPNLSDTRVPTVLSPLGDAYADAISDRLGVSIDPADSLVSLPFSRKAETSIRTKTYNFHGA